MPRQGPQKNIPLVLWVHGGPWARDEWGYNVIHQWLNNRGYAVLSVNFRGSVGFGKISSMPPIVSGQRKCKTIL